MICLLTKAYSWTFKIIYLGRKGRKCVDKKRSVVKDASLNYKKNQLKKKKFNKKNLNLGQTLVFNYIQLYINNNIWLDFLI